MLASTYKSACGGLIGIRYLLGPTPENSTASRHVTLDINCHVYARYFYSFVKFFVIEGVRINLRFRPETIYDISHAQYGSMVLSERLLALTTFPGKGRVIGDGDAEVRLEPIDFEPSRNPAVYDVPMAQHPLMYSKGFWNRPVEVDEPQRSILFIGNFQPGIYTRIESEHLFDVIGRLRLGELLCRSGLGRVASLGDLSVGSEGRVNLADSSQAPVPMEAFRQIVSSHGFFLCAPGAFMPLCHNLVEAMSVGAIPVIQRSYAELLEPMLEHGKNAIVFQGEEDFLPHVESALRMNKQEIGDMRRHVLEYYNEHLTPRAVVARVMAPEVRRIRMLAGEFSLAKLRKRQLTFKE